MGCCCSIPASRSNKLKRASQRALQPHDSPQARVWRSDGDKGSCYGHRNIYRRSDDFTGKKLKNFNNISGDEDSTTTKEDDQPVGDSNEDEDIDGQIADFIQKQLESFNNSEDR